MRHEFIDDFGDSTSGLTRGDPIGDFFEHRHGVGHGHRILALIEQGMIIFRIPDRHDVARRQARLVQSCHKTSSFVDPGRDNHDGVPIEDDL